jgi:hypothetical protein
LLACYASTVWGLSALGEDATFAYSADEAQYVMVAENWLRDRSFSYRGDFPLLVPPLYPAILALARLLSVGAEENGIVVLNALLISASLFPAYGIARRLDVEPVSALLFAVAAAWIANVSLVTRYMAEALYYPLFLVIVHLGLRMLHRPRRGCGATLGMVLFLAAMTKNAALGIALSSALYAASAAWFLRGATETTVRVKHTAIALGTTAILYLPWLLVRGAEIGFAPGAYIVSYQPNPEPVSFSLLARWWPGHLVVLFLGAGLVSLVPCGIGLRSLARDPERGPHQAIFLGALILVLSGGAALFDGAQIGRIADRYLFLLVPLILALALRGLSDPPRPGSVILSVATFATTAILVAAFCAEHLPEMLESLPWAFGFAGLFRPRSPTVTPSLLSAPLLFVAALLSLVWLSPSRWRPRVFAATIALSYVVMTANVFAGLRASTAIRREQSLRSGDLAGWLERVIGKGRKLLVVGERARFQPHDPLLDADPEIRDWTAAFGAPIRELLRAEAVGRYDVRMIPRLDLLESIAREASARHVLSVVPLDGPSRLGRNGLLNLYELDPSRAVGVSDEARFFLRQLSSEIGALKYDARARQSVWAPNRTPGLLTVGPGASFTPGDYELHACWRGITLPWRVSFEIFDDRLDGAVAAAVFAHGTDREVPRFHARAGHTYQFRSFLSEGRVLFCGAMARRIAPLDEPTRPTR